MARGAFWTIIVDDQPTAFRAPVREDLLPTLAQLHRQHPTAVIKWFQRGRLWETPGDAMDASKPPRRPGAWRPGGEHKDPRDQYKVPRDVKRARWASQAADGRGPWMKGDKPFNAERRTPNAEGRPAWKPEGERAANAERRPASSTGTGHREPETGGRPPHTDRPAGDRPAWKPREDRSTNAERRPSNAEGRPAWKPKGDRPTGDRPAWKPKGDGPSAARGERPAWKPREDRPANAERRTPNAEGRPAWKPAGERAANVERRPASSTGTGHREPGTGGRPPRTDRPASDRPAWKPKGDGPFGARGEKPAWKPKADRPTGDRPAWKPKGDGPSGGRGEKPAWKPKTDRPTGDRPAWKPREDRPANAERRTPNAEGRSSSSAPRGDWRGDRTGRDATPRAGGQAPPPAKKTRTWRAGELPPADRKRKKNDE